MAKNKNEQGIDLRKYRDPSGLSLNKLNFGLWLSEKRKNISRLVIIFLTVLSLIFFSYSIYNYIFYFLNNNTDNYEPTIVNSPKNQVADLEIGQAIIIKRNDNYDLAFLIKNPNDRFSANFNYCFLIGEEKSLCGSNFIFPGEEKYLLAFNQKMTSPDQVKIDLGSPVWKRLETRSIPDWRLFSEERLNFAVENVSLPSLGTGSTSANRFGYLEFGISNNTAYSYYEVPLNIILYKNSQVIGLSRYVINNFVSGEKRQVRLRWDYDSVLADKVEIKPEIDLLDAGVYFKY